MVFRSERKSDFQIKLDKDIEKKLRKREIIQEFINDNYFNNKNKKEEENSNLIMKTFNKKYISFGSLSERKFLYGNNNFEENIAKYHPYYLNNLYGNNINKRFVSIKHPKLKKNLSLKIFTPNQKRIKIFNSENDVPGPGQYFKENKKREKKKQILFRNSTFSFNETFTKNRVISIPSKFSKNKNNIEIIHNFFDKQENKEKKNNYKDKSSSNYIKNKINKNKNIILNNNERHFDSNHTNSNNSTSQTINNSLTIFNYNEKKNDLDKYFYTGQSHKVFKMSQGKIYKNPTFSIFTSNIFNKNNLIEKNFFEKENPRKSIFFDSYSTTAQKEKYFQNFGSSTIRNIFSQEKINFSEKYQPKVINNEKLKMEKSKSLKNLNTTTPSNIKKFYKSKKYILKENHVFEKKLLSSKIGSRMYESLKNRKIYKKDMEKFGSSEIRFPINLLETITPGPGFYYKDCKIKKINGHSFIPKNIIKDNLKGISKFKLDIFKESIKNEKNKSPSVGEYFPEKYNSIEYTNQKIKTKNKIISNKINNNNLKIQTNKLTDIQKENIIENINISYPKIIEQKAPFLSNENRKGFENYQIKDINYIVGPGSYLEDSYFDWNKKSYNLLFN